MNRDTTDCSRHRCSANKYWIIVVTLKVPSKAQTTANVCLSRDGVAVLTTDSSNLRCLSPNSAALSSESTERDS